MEGTLRLGIRDHRPTKSIDILGEDRVASRDRRQSQLREHLRPVMSQVLDDLAVQAGGIASAPQEDQREPGAEVLPGR